MSLQSQFISFHDTIKLDYDTRSELADKRDILIRKLRNSGELPGFEKLDQGSYGMYLGVEPVGDKEYDIDVALRFKVNKKDYEPMELKKAIYEVLKNHTEYGATIKKPCVTVAYKKDGEPAYHVDLVVCAYEDASNHNSQMYLAKGKESSPEEEIKWEKTDPSGLIDYINNAVEEDDREQYRRVIRYIKRWKNLKFSSKGHAEPASIGITLIAADYFKPDPGHDLDALLALCKETASLFQYIGFQDNKELYRIVYPMPYGLGFETDTDAFNKMTDIQMTDFKDKLDKLIKDLEGVKEEADEIEQCKKLNKIFGDDFPIPEVAKASKKQMQYIPSSSASGLCDE